MYCLIWRGTICITHMSVTNSCGVVSNPPGQCMVWWNSECDSTFECRPVCTDNVFQSLNCAFGFTVRIALSNWWFSRYKLLKLWVITWSLLVRKTKRLFNHSSDRPLLIRFINNVIVAWIMNEMGKTRDNIIVDSLLIAHTGKQCFGSVQSPT